MSWNAYIMSGNSKYRPSSSTPVTTSLTVNAVKGQWACFQVACVPSGEDVAGVNVAVTTPAKGGDSLNAPIIYKQIGYNVLVKSRDDGAIGEWFDALVPKVDPYYSQARNAFPFNVNRVSTSWPGTSNKVYSVFDITVANVNPVTRNNGASLKPAIGGTYSGGSALNYHIKIDGAGAKEEATFKWSDDGGATWDDTEVLTGDAIDLNNGLTITFDVQDYTLDDEWEFFANTFRSDMVWVDIFIPTASVIGTYTGTATISATSKDDIVLNYMIEVKDIAIPLTSSIQVYYTGSRDQIGKGHWQDYQKFTETAENLYKRYVEAGLYNRISIGDLPPSEGWNGTIFTGWTAAQTGTYYDWIAPYMDGSWSGGSKLSAYRPGLWSIVLYGSNPPVDISESQLDSVTAFYNLANANGWMGQYLELIAEEPSSISEDDTDHLIIDADAVHGVSATWKLVNTGSYRAEWVPYIDIWVPWLGNFATTPASSYADEIAAGRKLWSYLSCMSKGCNITGGSTYNKWPSHMVDATFQNLKGYYWLMFDNEGVTGDVYYQTVDGYRYYISSWSSPSPYDAWDSMFDFGGDGDGTIFYPGRVDKIGGTTDIPIDTLRLKALRQGLEDYEIFLQLPAYARTQIETVTAISTNKYFYTTPVDYDTMATQMETARDNVLNELLALSASMSPSGSPSLSSSSSMSPSESPSEGVSASVSASKSPSMSPSASVSPSVSPSEGPSRSLSASKSPSVSSSRSPSKSPSFSASVSPSKSPSFSASKSPSMSPSLSQSFSASVSPSVSPSVLSSEAIAMLNYADRGWVRMK